MFITAMITDRFCPRPNTETGRKTVTPGRTEQRGWNLPLIKAYRLTRISNDFTNTHYITLEHNINQFHTVRLEQRSNVSLCPSTWLYSQKLHSAKKWFSYSVFLLCFQVLMSLKIFVFYSISFHFILLTWYTKINKIITEIIKS